MWELWVIYQLLLNEQKWFSNVASKRERKTTWYSICSVSKCTPMNLALTSKTPTASDGEISKITFLNLKREEEHGIEKDRCTQSRHDFYWRQFLNPKQNSLVGLQVLDGDQHAFLMEPRGCVLLRNLFTLLRFVIAWFL